LLTQYTPLLAQIGRKVRAINVSINDRKGKRRGRKRGKGRKREYGRVVNWEKGGDRKG